MTTTEEQAKEIKEYKDFTSVTNIRKFTQQAMSPVIRSLQLQLSAMMDDHKELTKKVSKMEDIFRAQNVIEQRIQDSNRVVREYKDDQAFKRREDERKFTKLDAANQKLMLEIHSLKTNIQNQNQTIKQMAQRNTKSHEMYGSLTTNTDRVIKEMQVKYTEFTRQILDLTKMIKQQYQRNQSQMQVMREMFKTQRAALQQKTKPLSLFMSQRDLIRQQYDELYTKIIHSVTKEDFEAYRKSQKIIMDNQMKEIKKDIDETLPESLRVILPSVELKLKQVEKIKVIQKNCKQLELGIQSTVKKIAQTSDVFVVKIQQMAKEAEEKTTNIQTEIQTKIQELEEKQFEMAQKMEERIQQMKMEIHEQVSSIIEKQTSQIHKTIEAEVSNNKSLNRSNEAHSSARDEALRKQVEQVKTIKDKILSRYNRIQQLGQSIDSKIQGYSNKITRIKSDYQLFADNMRKEVSGVIKFRDTFLDRLQDVGKLLSSFTQTLLIMTSLLIQNNEEESFARSGKESKDPIVFVTDNDGIIFEWKPQNQKGWIQYRKQKMEIKQFLKSFMYSLITFVDDQFTNLSFLNWKDQKPSVFFRERVHNNYCISRKRIIESSSKQKVFHRRSPCYTSSNTCQNQNLFLAEQLDQPIVDPSASTKQFSRTIDSKVKLDRVLQQGNLILTNQQITKNYSIKRAKPLSSRGTSKQKSGTNDLSRYDQVFLTSRSACRSRISQLV